MKTIVGRIMLFFLFSTISIAGISQETDWADLPATSSSPKAMELYKSGLIAMADVRMNVADNYFRQAAEAEPNFIMPNVLLAVEYFYKKDMPNFKVMVGKVLSSTYSLNESEELIQQALKQLADNPIANATEVGEKLTKLNPKSVMAHLLLAMFQGFEGDYPSQVKTYQTILEFVKDPAPIYNSMAYNYLEQNNIDQALTYFEKYVSSAPKNPNVYDSMGDYYAKTQDYKKAHAYYMKAFRMDTANFKFSNEKAEQLKSKLGY